jgi:predicted hotdog family 3-hydroxylacyl-ACP dehydratase
MILIDRIVTCNLESLTAEVVVTSNSLFLTQNKQLPAWVIPEYMAQSISAWSGIHRLKRGQKISNGYLLGIRRFTSSQPFFKIGTMLKITVKVTLKDQGIGVFDCNMSTDNATASGILTVLQT